MKKTFASLALAIVSLAASAYLPVAYAGDNGIVVNDDSTGVDKAVYDNAKRDGLSNADASAKAGGYTPPAWEKKAEEGAGSFVYVTEKIPGANCTDAGRGSTQTTRLYKCTVGKGFDTVVGVLGSLIKYATYLTGLIGVLMIVLSGIQYSLSGGGEDAKKAKGRIMQLVTGLVLLFLTGLILNTVAPWVYN